MQSPCQNYFLCLTEILIPRNTWAFVLGIMFFTTSKDLQTGHAMDPKGCTNMAHNNYYSKGTVIHNMNME